jgi:hypothetical protein
MNTRNAAIAALVAAVAAVLVAIADLVGVCQVLPPA